MERDAYFIVKQVENTMNRYDMLIGCNRVIVALSGGADSVCLLSILRYLADRCRIQIEAAHVNHHLRAEASDQDERFVRDLCEKWKIPLTVKDADIKQVCMERKISMEEAGRDVRYAFFDELTHEKPDARIATAHNRNDNAETLIMHFLRGAGVDGMAGIPYTRGKIIRPILDLTREQVEKYNRLMSLEYVTDETNQENVVTRNRIRNQLLPQLVQEYNPNLVQTLAQSSEFVRADRCYLEQAADQMMKKALVEKDDKKAVFHRDEILNAGFAICIRVLKNTFAQWNLKVFPEFGWYWTVWSAIQRGSAKQIWYHNQIAVQVEEGCVRVLCGKPEKETNHFSCELKRDQFVWVEPLCRNVWMGTAKRSEENGFYFDADKVSGPVLIRSRRPGDFFYPLGLGGRKKVKDYFIDRKIPLEKRNQVPIICCGAGIMQVGNHIDSRFCISDDTKNILMIKF